jgi:hypothetical protein
LPDSDEGHGQDDMPRKGPILLNIVYPPNRGH